MKQATALKGIYLTLLTIAIIISILSCKKTEVVPFERAPNNTILEYKMTYAGDTLLGAIDNINNIIKLYVPYYVGVDVLVPAIKIDKDARLLDAADNVINLDGGILPVPLDTTGYVYQVAGTNNVKRRYTLVIEIAPHPDKLKAGYAFTVPGGNMINYEAGIDKGVYGRMPVYGNFGSTSANAKFTLTHRVSKKTFTDVIKTYEVTPGSNYYTMMVDISPYADSGYYDVEVKHQGRTAQLPPMHLVYQKPKFTNIRSTAAYAAGDTVTFSVIGLNTNNNQNGVLMGLERIYMKFVKTGFNFGGAYPATFPNDLFGKELEVKIVSSSRTEVKVIFPDVPAGAVGSYIYAFTLDFPGIGFYFDFNDATGWGKNNMLVTTGRSFTINPKP